MNVLYDTVHKRAQDTFDRNIALTKDNYKVYVDHWFKTANDLREEMISEGLLNTVKELDEWIEWNKKWSITK